MPLFHLKEKYDSKGGLRTIYVIMTFNRLGLMVVGGLALASFMTYASEHLATRSFLRGFEDRDGSRSRSFCLLC